MMPAWRMSQRLQGGEAALPVLKVLYRNAERIQEHGGRAAEVLKPIDSKPLSTERAGARLQAVMRTGNMQAAEQMFCGFTKTDPKAAFNSLQHIVQDNLNVHRVVLAWRAWDVLNLTGQEHAHTLLRQSVRFCTEREQHIIERKSIHRIRTVLPKLLDQFKLVGRKRGEKRGDDAWLAELTQAIFRGNRDQAAEAVAAALAEGYAADSVAEAISMAANQIVLHDPGRRKAAERKGHSARPKGSVHGDSLGVHASDAANAWRNIARVSNQRNTVAALIVGAYHTAQEAQRVGRKPYPFADEQEKLRGKDTAALLRRADEAIRNQDQAMAAAAVALYGQQGGDPRPAFDLLLQYAISQDGALHAEKYYQTVSEEYARCRSHHRWNHLIALARVTASEFGWPAPGHAAAVDLIKG